MNAVKSETRAACPRLWVTMAIVKRCCVLRVQSVLRFWPSKADRARNGCVEENNFGVNGHSARDAQALLLAAGKAETARMKLVLYLVPQGGAAQCLLHPRVKVAPAEFFVGSDPESDVVVNRHRKGRRLLKHHADARAQRFTSMSGDRISSVSKTSPTALCPG